MQERPPPLPSSPDRARRRGGAPRPPRRHKSAGRSAVTPFDPTVVGALDRSPLAAELQQAVQAEKRLLESQEFEGATEAGLSAHIRREESVIAKAALAKKNPIHRLQLRMKALHRAVRGELADFEEAYEDWQKKPRPPGVGPWRALFLDIAAALERMPQRRRVVVVSAPYLFALALALILLLGGSDPQAAVTLAPALTPAAAVTPAAAATADRAEPTAVSATSQSTMPATRAGPDEDEILPSPTLTAPRPAAGADDEAPSAIEVLRTLPIRAAIYAAPKKSAARVAHLGAGSSVLIYPSMPAPEGWIVARRPRGEIGFMVGARLEGERAGPDKKAERRGQAGKARHPRRSARVVDAPWPK
ncbi:MAG: hypothetical protein IT384_08155 [Deltaproteobacteria bacterium]|nr:hypothetical protein [Deltaproteobacteria bacterium]